MNIAFISLGCPKNQVDADVLCHSLLAAGHRTVPTVQQADIVIVNTCGFIESAKAESIENILMACAEKKENSCLKVIVTGCLAERYQSELAAEIPEVDAVVGIGSNKDICAIIEEIEKENAVQVQHYGAKTDLDITQKRVISTPSHYAYLKISEGCNNRCHYCAIPLIRGNLRSRAYEDILKEAQWLAEEGVKELILVAQDYTAYGDDLGENRSAQLLYDLNKIEGIEWIRILYAYPERINDAFVKAMAENDKVVKYLDVPIQHINSRVLQSMNRKGDRNTVITALDKLRAAMPEIVLRTTLIAGYPGETEDEFCELAQFVRDYKFDRLGCFAYSEEENTVAATMPQLDMEIREKRAEIIMNIQSDIMAAKQGAKIGSTQIVLVDEYDDEENTYIGRTAADAPDIDTVVFIEECESALATGMFVSVQIDECDGYDLFGHLIRAR
ncbi:MAG: 30S ribosomal protein S12 methylthiotransferase RimO [Oscillospiraceae bacterium]|nr:30S ribosomal protein S12 methylthiotransferase RimO [Oscillospiraceae bacterium]